MYASATITQGEAFGAEDESISFVGTVRYGRVHVNTPALYLTFTREEALALGAELLRAVGKLDAENENENNNKAEEV